MSAHTGNRYAEKWTYEATMRALEKIHTFAMMEDTLYLGMALARAGYYDDIWRYWQKKWSRHFEIMHEMKQLKQHFEARIFTESCRGKIPVSLGMFALRHHYGWGREVWGEGDLSYLNAGPDQALPEEEGLMQTATSPNGGLEFQQSTLPEEEGLMLNRGPHPTLLLGKGLTAGSIQTFIKEEDLMQTATSSNPLQRGGLEYQQSTLPEEEGLILNHGLHPTLPQGEGLTAGPIQTFIKEEDLTVDPIQTFPKGEGFNTGCMLDGLDEEEENEGIVQPGGGVSAKDTRVKKLKRYPIEWTPEELEMETGISDIREIERLMRLEDEE